MFGYIINVRIVNAWLTVSTRGSVTFSRRSRHPFKKFRLLVVATTKGAIKVSVRVGRPPNEQPESPQVCHLKTRVHHLTQGVSYNDVGRWPRFGKLFLWLHNKKQGFFWSISPKCTSYSAVGFFFLMHSTLDNEFDLRLIQWFWWPLCYCVLIPNIS